MKTLRDYISQTEQILEEPKAGDDFDLDLAADCLIETYVAHADDDSVIVYVDEAAYETLERAGYLDETIRTYGPVGAGPGTGYVHTAAREDTETCDECGYPMQECCCEETHLDEGALKQAMHSDAESMDLKQFIDKYGDQDWVREFWNDINVPMHGDEKNQNHFDFGRIMELAGVADGKYNQQDDVYTEMKGVADGEYNKEDDSYCEDQDAAVVAQKELDTDITDPMPGVHEAEYHGRKVSLGKPFLTPDGPKKRAVYVKNPKGNVVKVNFGDKKLKIKKNIPARRRSFRARHHCENPGPRHKARYWSCRAW